MLEFLVKRFVKDSKEVHRATVREQYGKLSSVVGVIVNLSLFIAKFTVGTMFHSISITGDAFNNLSDAGSSVISLVSFKLSGKPADKKHPFGYARVEYIASSVIAFLILVIGIELIRTSIDKIIHPNAIEFKIVSVCVLFLSIAVKLWLYRFNRTLGKRIESSMLLATSADSLADVMATFKRIDQYDQQEYSEV